VPYVTRDQPIRQARPRGFGATTDWAAQQAYAQDAWLASLTATELTQQSTFACQVLQTWIAGGAVTLPPWPTDARSLAQIAHARGWLLDLPEAVLQELFPGVTSTLLARARRELLPGVDLIAVELVRLQSELTTLTADRARVAALQAEVEATLTWGQAVLKQFQTYVTWFQHHLEAQAKKTAAISTALTAISTVAQFVPVVGWAVALILDVANVGIQLDAFRDTLKALEAAGGRAQAGYTYVATMEACAQAYAALDALAQDLDVAIAVREAERALLVRLRAAAGGSAVVVAPHSSGRPAAATDRALMAMFRGASGGGRLLVAAGLVALALLGRRR